MFLNNPSVLGAFMSSKLFLDKFPPSIPKSVFLTAIGFPLVPQVGNCCSIIALQGQFTGELICIRPGSGLQTMTHPAINTLTITETVAVPPLH